MSGTIPLFFFPQTDRDAKKMYYMLHRFSFCIDCVTTDVVVMCIGLCASIASQPSTIAETMVSIMDQNMAQIIECEY